MPDVPGGPPATSPLSLPVLETPSDAALIAAARAGDGFAATRLWHRHEASAVAAATATPGSAEVDVVVESARAILMARLVDSDTPFVGAVRPHVLASVREAAAAADGRGSSAGGGTAALLAPEDWYRADLPEGIADGAAVAAAYTSLGTAAQESLWAAEIDALPPAELAAALGCTIDEADHVVAAAGGALRDAWIRQTIAATASDGACAEVLPALRGNAGVDRLPRRVRAHFDACPSCRAAALPPSDLARRLVGLLPLLVLGGASGIAFLDATRRGSAGAVLAPLPPVSGRRTGSTSPAEPTTRGAATIAGLAALATAAASRLRAVPPAVLVAAPVTAVAATALIVLALSGGPADDGAPEPAGAAGAADLSAAAPDMAPPEIRTTELPDDPEAPPADGSRPDASAAPEASDEAGGDTSDAPAPTSGSGDVDPDGSGAGTGDDPDDGTTARPDEGTPEPAAAPGAPAAPAPAPLAFEVGEPGDGGWRSLVVTGTPGTAFAILDGSQVLLGGVLDGSGTAAYSIRGSIAKLSVVPTSTTTAQDDGAVARSPNASSSARSAPGRSVDHRLVPNH
ncbi:hypothetical protein [Agromyces sp. SYSU T0242]|uniref:hypothetical protein n=1 Tax=Agromyces litoreus TaxID=3158561 RepID=UPI00339B6270